MASSGDSFFSRWEKIIQGMPLDLGRRPDLDPTPTPRNHPRMTARPTGYYWISGPDEPEVARWDADTESWALFGAVDLVDDADVTVLDDEPLVRGRGAG